MSSTDFSMSFAGYLCFTKERFKDLLLRKSKLKEGYVSHFPGSQTGFPCCLQLYILSKLLSLLELMKLFFLLPVTGEMFM